MKRLVLIVAMLLIAVPVMAGNALVDFESPEYTVGGLEGQHGWTGTPSVYWWVENAHPLAGAQSMKVTGPSELYFAVPGGTTIGDGTVMSMRTEISGDTGAFMFWNMMVAGINCNFAYYQDTYCGINLENGKIRVSDNSTPVYGWLDTGYTYVTGHVYDLSMTFDFTNQVYAVGVSDLTNPASSFSIANIAFQAPCTAASAMGGQVYMGGSNTYYDNLSVSTVPEPSALVALATGMMGICGFSLRRKK